MLTKDDLQSLCTLVRTSARDRMMSCVDDAECNIKPDGSLVTDRDVAMQAYLCRELEKRWPGVPVLGEEMTAERQRETLSAPVYWCLDPIDGTSNFAAGLPFFAVSLAYIVDGEVRAGLVYDPSRDECFSALAGGGAWLNGTALNARPGPDQLDRALAVVDLKRLPRDLRFPLIENPPYLSQRYLGAVALEWCWLAAGRFHLYLHGGQKLWDYAAGWLVCREAGAQACLLEGLSEECQPASGLEPRMAVGAANESLHLRWRAWLGARL